MHFVARMLLSLVIFCVIGSVVIKTANAEGEFETSYEVTYAIDNNGCSRLNWRTANGDKI